MARRVNLTIQRPRLGVLERATETARAIRRPLRASDTLAGVDAAL